MNTIKEKINNLMPSVAYLVIEFKDEGLGGKAFFMMQNVLYNASTIAERHVNDLELAQKFNLEAVQEINAGLEQQLLAERAKVDALIAEIDELIVYNDGGDFDFIREKDLRESTNKYRSTK